MRFFSKNERYLKLLKKITSEVAVREPIVNKKNKMAIKEEFANLKGRCKNSPKKPLNIKSEIIRDAIVLFREIARRTLKERPYDQQIWAGLALYEGHIIDMKNGEGKTLSAVIPSILEYLNGNRVHIYTHNDYLARRDSEWMGVIYDFLDIRVSHIAHDMDDEIRREAYGSDVVYGTCREFGFDYLRDHMKFDKTSLVQGELSFALIDEIDSILIDDARTPLIISGPSKKSHEFFHDANNIVLKLIPGEDYTIDESSRNVKLSDIGLEKIERLLGTDNLYDPFNMGKAYILHQALKANTFFHRDVDYILEDGEVIIVDEFTGRPMSGRRYSDGLHQALEAKEGVQIQPENETLCTITVQNFLKLYNKIAGMSGTASFDANEYKAIYRKDVVQIPSRFANNRIDWNDAIYQTQKAMLGEACKLAERLFEKKQPVLLGTLSVKMAENIARYFDSRGIPYELLDAKNHEREANILEKAGQIGSITIAAKMAGRGTDIKLGNRVEDLGGLFVLGIERHESIRMDEQLKGRAGRHGNKGQSQFFLSLEDDLLRIFGGQRIMAIMEQFGMEENEAIEHTLISKAVENAQKKLEKHNYLIRKNLLDYDLVLDEHRYNIYQLRTKILEADTLREELNIIIENVLHRIQQSLFGLYPRKSRVFVLEYIGKINHIVPSQHINPFEENTSVPLHKLKEWAKNLLTSVFEEKERQIGKDDFDSLIRLILLQSIDNQWKKHINQLTVLESKRAMKIYSHDDFLAWYRLESDRIFDELISNIEYETLGILSRIQYTDPADEGHKQIEFEED